MRRALAIVVAVAIAACGRGGGGGTSSEEHTATGVRAAPVIDSHVHLSYVTVAKELARNGVVAAVDLGAPIDTLGSPAPPLIALVQAGPMITSPDGYPINAWDPGGFGQGCDDASCVEATIATIAARGGKVAKLALGPDGLDAALVPVAVAAAHSLGR